MSPKPLLRSPTAENPSDDMPPEDAVASLLVRVRAARALREHHVWEAVRILPQVAGLSADIRQSPPFRVAMEKNALREALSLIAKACCPARRFHVLGRVQEQWVCVLQIEDTPAEPRHKIIRAAHADPAAAILAALLRSSGGPDGAQGRRTRPRAGIEQGAFHG